MNPINNIFATHYALGVRMKHRDPMSTGFLGFFMTEVAVLSFIGVIIGQFVTIERTSIWRSKNFIWGASIAVGVLDWLYFYGAKKGAKAWADYSLLSIGWKRFWAFMSIFAIAGPCVAMLTILS